MAAPNEKELYVLTGPTAVGKTELALRWAELHEAEIVSCDSLLFYRGMDIGTAKPTTAERARVPHHLIDICDLRERMDVTRYVEAVRKVLDGLHARGRRVLVTGGSGFYLRCFFAPVADEVTVPPELRAELERRLAADGLEALAEELKTLDGPGAAGIDLHNPRRVVRALERIRTTGRSLAELAEAFANKPPPFADWSVKLVRLDRPGGAMQARTAARIDQMLRDGLVEEVRRLIPLGLKENPSASKAIGYRETIDFLEGRLSQAELHPAILKDTRALLKKQRTWFKTQLPPHVPVNPDDVTVETLFAADRRA
ncbi:tRNA (adenosine(37)-N6)-dimethylallyltransferase MiaA [Opitutaceae bacterium EW11]|nr:tRNA (adenosine(37)-N6)-dimethylallyltransferase MiaA [Opitutaceae bacterium EW11]